MTSSKKHPSRRFGILSAVLAASAFSSAFGANGTWLGTTDALWATPANWSGGNVPGTGDTATFNGPSSNLTITPGTITLASILFDTASAGAYTISGGSGNAITLNNGGSITMNATVATAQTIAAPLTLGTDGTAQTFSFTNNSTTVALNISGSLTGSTGVGLKSVLVSGAGATTLGGLIADGTSGTVGIVKTGAGTLTMGAQANTFTGGLVIKQGTVVGGNNLNTFGADSNVITLGDAVVGADATLSLGNALVRMQPIVVAAGAGNRTLLATNTGANTVTLAGAITLNNNVTINASATTGTGTSNFTLTGGITGTGNIVIANTGIAARQTNITTGLVNNVGTITNSGTGAAPTVISSVIGTNVTGVTQNSATSSLTLSGANTFTSNINVSAGTLRAGIASVSNTSGAFGRNAAVILANVAGATLDLNGFNSEVGLLQGGGTLGGNVTLGSATLTTGGKNTSGTFFGAISGTGGVTKVGTGIQQLSGVNSYTGVTTINAGTLRLNVATGSMANTPKISIASGAKFDVVNVSAAGAFTLGAAKELTGSGSVGGNITANAGSIISPGTHAAGSAGAGSLSFTNLTLATSSNVNFGLSSSNSLNSYVSATSLALATSGSITLNLYTPETATAFTTPGTYNLFQYTTLAAGDPTTVFQIGTSLAGLSASFGTAAGPSGTTYITLTLTSFGASGNWIGGGGANTNWSAAANWQGGTIPGALGDTATFGAAATPGTVTLDSARTLGTLVFDNAVGSYTITGPSTLSMDGSSNTAAINVTSGSHSIQAPISLVDNLSISPQAGSQLTISGPITEATAGKTLTVTGGSGTVILTGTNTYTGGTIFGGGVLQFSSLANLGSGDLNFTGGTLRYAAGNAEDISVRPVTLGIGGGTIDVGTNNVTFANPIGNSGAGSLTKAGSGTLTLAAGNTYTGGTVFKGGVLSIADETSLGVAPSVAATNLTFDPGAGNTATLQTQIATTIGATRSVTLNSGRGAIDTLANAVTVAGIVSGGGALQKLGTGSLTLSGVNTYTGGTFVNGGTLILSNGNSAGTGTITLANGVSLQLSSVGNGNPLALSGAGANAFIISGSLSNGASGAVTGSADQTLTVSGATQLNFSSSTQQFQNFLGTVSVPAGTGIRFSNNSLNNGGDNTTFDVNGGISGRVGGALAFGALTGSGTIGSGTADSGPYTMAFTIGAKNIDTTFSGVIRDGDVLTGKIARVTKVGTGVLTLSGVSTYTGATAVSGGTLNVTGSLNTASAVTVNATGTLSGSGTVGAVTVNGGVIAAGSSSGTILHTGNLTIGATGTLNSKLSYNGLIPNYTTVSLAAGTVSLTSGANLQLTLDAGFVGSAGDLFYLVVNQDVTAVAGTFTQLNGVATNLAEGSIFSINSKVFQITYQANSSNYSFTGGNDVALMAVPEPGIAVLLLAGLAFIFLFRLREKRSIHHVG